MSTGLFRNRTSNLGLVTQNTQWLLLMGVSFVVAAYLQVVRGYDAIQTGVIFTAATAGLRPPRWGPSASPSDGNNGPSSWPASWSPSPASASCWPW